MGVEITEVHRRRKIFGGRMSVRHSEVVEPWSSMVRSPEHGTVSVDVFPTSEIGEPQVRVSTIHATPRGPVLDGVSLIHEYTRTEVAVYTGSEINNLTFEPLAGNGFLTINYSSHPRRVSV